jgi:hypothetical protein
MSNPAEPDRPADPYAQPMPPPGAGHQAPPGYGQGYPPPYGRPYGYPPPTNGMAIASLVLGILGFLVVTAILALVFGYVGRNQIRQNGSYGWGMATAGVVLGWVWLGLVFLRLLATAAHLA